MLAERISGSYDIKFTIATIDSVKLLYVIMGAKVTSRGLNGKLQIDKKMGDKLLLTIYPLHSEHF